MIAEYQGHSIDWVRRASERFPAQQLRHPAWPALPSALGRVSCPPPGLGARGVASALLMPQLSAGRRAASGPRGCTALCQTPHHRWADEHGADEQQRHLLHTEWGAREDFQQGQGKGAARFLPGINDPQASTRRRLALRIRGSWTV